MRIVALLLIPVLLIACGGSGSAPAATTGNTLTAQELVENCVTTDLQDLADLLNILQNFLNADEGAPLPEFDLLAGFLTGKFPYTLDTTGNGEPDIFGTIHFTDENGDVTLPVSDINDLLDADLDDLTSIVSQIPPGTNFHLTFDFDGALAGDPGNTGEGEFVFTLGGTGLDEVTVSGDGTFTTGDCVFAYDFDDIGGELLNGEFPVAAVDFDLTVGTDLLEGGIVLDGTSQAAINAALNGGASEDFLIDLTGFVPPTTTGP